MSEQEKRERKGLKSPVMWFFIMAICCVVAFLIVALVKSCDAERADEKAEKDLQELVGMAPSYEIQDLA